MLFEEKTIDSLMNCIDSCIIINAMLYKICSIIYIIVENVIVLEMLDLYDMRMVKFFLLV